MKMEKVSSGRPVLKTKGFSRLHIQIFEYVLIGKTNRDINKMFQYSIKSGATVRHSRMVMYKLLTMEGLCKKNHTDKVVYPRDYRFWWNSLLNKHKADLLLNAIEPKFYDPNIIFNENVIIPTNFFVQSDY